MAIKSGDTNKQYQKIEKEARHRRAVKNEAENRKGYVTGTRYKRTTRSPEKMSAAIKGPGWDFLKAPAAALRRAIKGKNKKPEKVRPTKGDVKNRSTVGHMKTG